MAAIEVVVTYPAITGTAEAAPVADAGAGFQFLNDGNVLLKLHNTTGGALTVHVNPQATLGGFTLDAQEIDVPAGATHWAGPFPPVIFNSELGLASGTADTGIEISALGI